MQCHQVPTGRWGWSGSLSNDDRDVLSDAEEGSFEAEDEAHGSELWVTDGTTAGTTVIDTIPGTDGLEPNYMTSTSHGIIFTSEYGSDPAPWIIEVI